jgi:hypothetical protein
MKYGTMTLLCTICRIYVCRYNVEFANKTADTMAFCNVELANVTVDTAYDVLHTVWKSTKNPSRTPSW